MRKTIINTATQEWFGVVILPDDWTGAPGEWQVSDGHEIVPVDGGSPGHVWDGNQFNNPNAVPDLTEEEWQLLDWHRRMDESDLIMPRWGEDLFDSKSSTEKSRVAQTTRDKMTAKKAARDSKP